jgi:hypothetical protein
MKRNAKPIVRGTREKQGDSRGMSQKKAENNTEDHSFSVEDRRRYVEWEVRRLTIKNGEYTDERGKWLLEGKSLKPEWKEGDELTDFAVWLLKERGKSWHQIPHYFVFSPPANEENIETYESRARRAYDRVERRHPGSKSFKSVPLTEAAQAVLLGVTLAEITSRF